MNIRRFGAILFVGASFAVLLLVPTLTRMANEHSDNLVLPVLFLLLWMFISVALVFASKDDNN